MTHRQPGDTGRHTDPTRPIRLPPTARLRLVPEPGEGHDRERLAAEWRRLVHGPQLTTPTRTTNPPRHTGTTPPGEPTVTYLDRVRAAITATLTHTWWAEVLEASWRQAYQILVPFLIVVIGTGRVDIALLGAVLLQLAGGEIVVVGRRLAALTVPDDASLTARVIARALSAFAGAVLGYVLTVPFAEVLALEWPTILMSAVATTVLALIGGKVAPAVSDAKAVADVPQDAPGPDPVPADAPFYDERD